MQRKTVLNHLETLLKNTDGVCSNNLKAELILSQLEAIGMLPPKTTKIKRYRIADHILGDELYEKIEETNEWDN